MNDQDSQFDSLLPPLKLDRRASSPRRWRRDFRWRRAGGGADGDSPTPPACWPAGWTFRWPTARCRPIAPRRRARRTRPRCWWCPRYSACTSTSRISAAAWRIWGIWRWRPSCSRARATRRATDIPKLQAEIISKVPDAQVQRDLDAASAWAAEHGGDAGWASWVLLGRTPGLALCRAQSQAARGRCLVRAAGRRAQRAEAAPGTERGRGPEGAGAGAYGGDAGIPLADVDRMRWRWPRLAPPGLAHRHLSEAPHAFHADYRPSYRKAEADQAWQRMLDWFNRTGWRGRRRAGVALSSASSSPRGTARTVPLSYFSVSPAGRR